jgi:hypothetical protein
LEPISVPLAIGGGFIADGNPVKRPVRVFQSPAARTALDVEINKNAKSGHCCNTKLPKFVMISTFTISSPQNGIANILKESPI